MNRNYDFVVIGAGISACTFASCLNFRLPNSSILLIEHGRQLGGRSTTRQSRSYPTYEYDHGLPAISLSNEISDDLSKFLLPLIKTKTLIDITKDIFMVNQNSDIDHMINLQINKDKIYRGFPHMSSICKEIIKQAANPSKIDFSFKTLVKSFKKENNFWEIVCDSKNNIKSSNLIISSSLIAHPRCLDIMNIQTLPLRKAFLKGEDQLIEDLLLETSKQTYLKRKNFIFHIKNLFIANKFNYKYLQIWFSSDIKDKFSYERLIFQKQLDGSIIAVLHCTYTYEFNDNNLDIIINDMINIFSNHQNFVDLFLNAKLLDVMNWRASQPIDNLVSTKLQFSSSSHIGFCGDWFDSIGCSGFERAMNSSIRLAKSFSKE
tara:strand:- start:3354 stop:4481 length:1128 start_codon:yes stop_codon:yes gene_type:complete